MFNWLPGNGSFDTEGTFVSPSAQGRGPVDSILEQGLKGETGSPGMQGVMGHKGYRGEVGSPGPAGSAGRPGPTGRRMGSGNSSMTQNHC